MENLKRKRKVNLCELMEEFKSVSEFAREYGVDRISAHQWKNLKNLPSARVMVLIFKKSKGRCTYQNMVESFVRGF